MLDWCKDIRPLDQFTTKIYLDTNILIFLSDRSFVNLQEAFNILTANPFVQLTSSQYALFEYLENRKKKHYKNHLQQAKVQENLRAVNWINKRLLNPVSLHLSQKSNKIIEDKYYYSYNIRGHSYLSIWSDVHNKVEKEITELKDSYLIKYDSNVFNNQLFEPTKQLCLSSRVSRQDCMIVTSAVFSDIDVKNKDIVIWTGDEDFYKAYHECDQRSSVFSGYEPTIEWINNLSHTDGKKRISLNLRHTKIYAQLNSFIVNKLKEYILVKNHDSFLGRTDSAPKLKDIVFFQTETEVHYNPEGFYFTIISKNLNFHISSKNISSLWLDGKPLVETDYPIAKGSVISVTWLYNSKTEARSEEIMKLLKQPGHLVFITPESI